MSNVTPKVLATLALLIMVFPISAQEEKLAGTVQVGRHTKELETGKIYHIKIQGKDFQPTLTWVRAFVPSSSVTFKNNTYEGYFSPRERLVYNMLVVPSFVEANAPEGPLMYTMTIRPIVLGKEAILEKKDSLAKEDPIYANPKLFFNRKTHFKAFAIKLDANKFYSIEMIRSENTLDPYIYLEGPDGAIVGQDDDGAGNLNSRLIYRPQQAGDYRIIATSLSPATGAFSLSVRTETK